MEKSGIIPGIGWLDEVFCVIMVQYLLPPISPYEMQFFMTYWLVIQAWSIRSGRYISKLVNHSIKHPRCVSPTGCIPHRVYPPQGVSHTLICIFLSLKCNKSKSRCPIARKFDTAVKYQKLVPNMCQCIYTKPRGDEDGTWFFPIFKM